MASDEPSFGYDDTPMLPGGQWHVHDGRRPQPRIVTPGTESTQVRAGRPPSDAIVLFDGTDLSQWRGRHGAAQWRVADDYMEVNGTGSIETIEHFGDCQLHVEWAAPGELKGSSQGRGNSGVFLMGRYEIQVLDGYKNPTYADGMTAAIYGQYPPLVNACREPGVWQTYDIFFTGPCWEGDRLVRPAYATVVFNGVLVQNHEEILGPTGHRFLASYDKPHPSTGPLMLQDHGGDKVRYRNIWIRPL